MKLDFRSRTTYTLTQVTEAITLDSEDFRNAVPPYKGETEEDFWDYINDNLSDWEAEEYIGDNEDNFSEDLKDKLWQAFYEYPTQEMFDSRMKSDTITMEAGKIDEEYTKYNGFNAKYNNDFS
jgi:hypothetical protein|tara:strand:+ start:743 stop:1111 length:369 start_codon:yes stop_codon:yes gene_type:complete